MTKSLRDTRIEQWTHKKALYDRHLAGETYRVIAADLGVPIHNVVRHVQDWRETLERYPDYLQGRESMDVRDRTRADRFYAPLIDSGLIGTGKRSPEYGYA